MRSGTKRLIRDLNFAAVINIVRRHEPISRVEIAERSGLARSTVTNIINSLLQDGLLVEVGSAESSGGRKPVLLSLNSRSRFVVGIKLAPTRVTTALADLHAQVVQRHEQPIDPRQGAEAVITALAGSVHAVCEAHDTSLDEVLGVGLVMPGIVDRERGVSRSSYFLGWHDIPVRASLEDTLGVPVFVDNDANAYALAEHWYGAGQGASDLLIATVGIGIGAGILIGGQIHRGACTGAGEIGHTTLDPNGPQCACGKLGCLEAMAGDRHVIRLAQAAVTEGRGEAILSACGGDPAAIGPKAVVDAATAGDRTARQILAEVGTNLGTGLANAVNLLNPQRIVLGGEAVMAAGDLLLDPVRHALRAHAFSVLADDLPVAAATLGPDAWLMGAATLVLEEAFKPPLYDSAETDQVNLARSLT